MILTVTLNPAIDKVYEVNSFSVGKVFRANNVYATAGGKGLNVSRVASIMGGEVVATGFLGGRSGQFIRKGLKAHNIIDAFVEIQEESRTCIAINDPISNTSTEVLEPGPKISLKEQVAFIDNFRILAKDADIVTISGSLPNGVPFNFYGELILVCKDMGKRVLLDTSGKTLKVSIDYLPYLIKPNNSELGFINGKKVMNERDILEEAIMIHNKGIDVVCVTLGEKGSLAVTNEGIFRLNAPPMKTISTVGSGDSFIAGCTIALVEGKSIEDVLKIGIACGVANTQFGKTGYVSKKMVEDIFHVVNVEKIKD